MIKWLKDTFFIIVGGVLALYVFYIKGKSDEKKETKSKLFNQYKKAKHIDNISFRELVDRMREYNDK